MRKCGEMIAYDEEIEEIAYAPEQPFHGATGAS
jgi:hypothetical protein